MIQIINVDFAYKRKNLLLSDLSMNFEPGSVYGLLGKNGAGKTTLMKLISGVCFPDSGQIMINGEKSNERNPNYLSRLFLVPEEFDFEPIKISSFVKINSPFYEKFDNSQFDRYLEEFNISKVDNPVSMSLGEKKKFILSFALACNTDILLMDEPTNGLDINSKVIFRKIMASLSNDDRIFIISTHQVKDVEDIIDKVTIIDNGKIRLTASLNEILDKIMFIDSENVPDENILYKAKRFNRDIKICKNNGSEFTRIDLELLFNAVINNESALINLFNTEKTEI